MPTRARRCSWLALCLPLLSGCFEAQVEVRVLADGSGLVQVDLVLPREALAAGAAGQLLLWRGIDAWSEIELRPAGDEGHLRLVATGWASHLEAVRAPLEPSPVLGLERAPAGARVRLAPAPTLVGLDAPAWATERRRLLEQRGALAGARCGVRLVLPGPTASGERSVERAWDGARLGEGLAAVVGEVEALRGRVAAGELGLAEGTAREGDLLAKRLGLEAVEVALPADGAAASGLRVEAALFARGLAAAREAWARREVAPSAGGPGARTPAQPIDPILEQARRELEAARADGARAQAELERWERELAELTEGEEDQLRAEAMGDPGHARLLVELEGAPPGVQPQLLATPLGGPAGAGQTVGTVLEEGRCDLPGLQPGAWRITVLAIQEDGREWSWTRETRLVGGSLARLGFAWPNAGGTLAGKVAPGPGRVLRAWSHEQRLCAPLGPDGAFSLGPLPPGTWTVAVTEGLGPWLEDPSRLPASVQVEVREGVTAQVAPPGVRWDGTADQVLWR